MHKKRISFFGAAVIFVHTLHNSVKVSVNFAKIIIIIIIMYLLPIMM